MASPVWEINECLQNNRRRLNVPLLQDESIPLLASSNKLDNNDQERTSYYSEINIQGYTP